MCPGISPYCPDTLTSWLMELRVTLVNSHQSQTHQVLGECVCQWRREREEMLSKTVNSHHASRKTTHRFLPGLPVCLGFSQNDSPNCFRAGGVLWLCPRWNHPFETPTAGRRHGHHLRLPGGGHRQGGALWHQPQSLWTLLLTSLAI